MADLALAGGAVGIVAGTALRGRAGPVGLVVGAVVGTLAGLILGPRRLRFTVDHLGVSIGRLTGRVDIAWEDIVAFGVEDGWQGRRGRTAALAVGRRGDDWPIAVPALAYAASGFRVGATPPDETLAPYRSTLLDPVRPWASARHVTLVEAEFDDWWDRARLTGSTGTTGTRRD